MPSDDPLDTDSARSVTRSDPAPAPAPPMDDIDIFGTGSAGTPSATLGRPNSGVAQVDETDRLKFAREILFSLFFFVILIVTLSVIFPDNKALDKIFDWAKIGVLPLVTLVIGFYFPNSQRHR